MTTSTTMIHDALQWRYATKQFDPSKKISDADWQTLAETLRLTPSSYGLQPWQFVLVQTPTLRTALRAVSWNQAQVEDCSHYVVLTSRRTMTAADVDRYVQSIAQTRGIPVEQLAGYRGMMMSDIVDGPRAAWAADWAARQTYIAFGMLMETAALLRIDACPMEGLDPAQYDELLGLTQSPYRTIAACALGYRSTDDAYQHLAKVRYPLSDVLLVK